MGKRHLALALWWFLIIAVAVSQTHGARHSQVFQVKPKSQNSPNNFMGFLPKGRTIPSSGPSKKHNDIGLQSSERSP
ncbi:Protein IDA-LIKE 2 [Morella rubra]|uniref:Protein IDA-LIKE 2 n=1 Tax=Morella rubra TaxID=262757 RepID=A0A6A1W6V2_9ROSI|nr:Protein IDA-LIKE 2 [Morella rubra]